jgi:hypothetical protein
MQLKPLLGIALVGLTELGLLAFAASADVPADYRAYYIDRTTGCLPQPVSGEYRLGATLSLSGSQPQAPLEAVMVCGFGDPEPDGAWLRGPEARLHFGRTPEMSSDLSLEIDGRGATNKAWPRQHATVTVNGEPVGELDYPDGDWRVQSVVIPRHLVTQSATLDIVITMTDTRAPGSVTSKRDARRFSVFVRSLRLSSAQ